jgi:deoxyribodipyrimidine photo-lyase
VTFVSSVKPISIVWFKRDLRISDHQPLKSALEAGNPVLLLHITEPLWLEQPDFDLRHLRFVMQSLGSMDAELAKHRYSISRFYGEAMNVFNLLTGAMPVAAVYSYLETGNRFTFDRDKSVAGLLKSREIRWFEFEADGIKRGIKHRNGWAEHIAQVFGKPLAEPDWKNAPPPPAEVPVDIKLRFAFPESVLKSIVPDASFQPGGTHNGLRYLESFLNHRSKTYMASISKPEASRNSCSRISPYLAWGNLSVRQVLRAMQPFYGTGNDRNLKQFADRLHWRVHFIQRFESNCQLESELQSPLHEGIRQDWDEERYLAWENGQSGFPLVDACIRAVKATGYLNFRMRSMLVSFLTHHLWLDWRRSAHFLARQFLDYEPGIHYCQFQMQSATSGVHTIRVYNPVKQSLEHDPEGVFIRKWLPELGTLPLALLHQPWKMSAMEQQMFGVEIGKDYPAPVIDHEASYRRATETLWKLAGSGPKLP